MAIIDRVDVLKVSHVRQKERYLDNIFHCISPPANWNAHTVCRVLNVDILCLPDKPIGCQSFFINLTFQVVWKTDLDKIPPRMG